MKALTAHANEVPRHLRPSERYSWDRDFPISLRTQKNGLESVFRLEFSLTDSEIAEFKTITQSALNGNLPIEIKIGRQGQTEIKVRKQGPSASSLSKQSTAIAKYVAEKIQFIYIPAIRTEGEVLEVVQEMLSAELENLESDQEYAAAIQKISELQQPILQKVSDSILSSLKQFLPSIKGVTVHIPNSARRHALRNQCKVEVDDGSRTLLEHKGDGVKSLAALGLLKDRNRTSGASVIAIEEPEAHLHPGAIHGLREVISSLSTNNQVVITTHCPVFVDRNNIRQNILISENSATPAKDITTIRELLGIRASDNLVNASHVLVVEGKEDVIALNAILPTLSPKISRALKQHHLVIEEIGGAGNLSYKLTLLNNALCATHVLLDNDEAGNEAYKKASEDNLLTIANVTFVNCNGMRNSELEDVFNSASYENEIFEKFGVVLKNREFKTAEKWSDRIKKCFQKQGKPWDKTTEPHVKSVVAEAIAKAPDNSLNPHKRSAIDALVTALENKLEKTHSTKQ